jgi:co-chaperonin GroES (HSP10)
MELTPLGSRVLVRPTPPDTESPGGLLLPEIASVRSATSGTVMSAGSGTAAAHRIRQAAFRRCLRIVEDVAETVPASALKAELIEAIARAACEAEALSEVHPGDTVYFPFTAGALMQVEGVGDVIVLDEAAIEAVWTPEEQAA